MSEGTKCVTTGWGFDRYGARLQQQIAEIRTNRECETLYKRAKPSERICLSMGCTCMENGMPLACKTGSKVNFQYVLSGVKLADGRIVSRKTDVHSENCGRVPRLFVPVAPYVEWIKNVIGIAVSTMAPALPGIYWFWRVLATCQLGIQKSNFYV